MVAHSNGPGACAIYKITVHGGFPFGRFDKQSDGSTASTTSGGFLGKRLVLDAGTGPSHGQLLSPALLEETHLNGSLTFLESNGTGTTLNTMNAIVVHDEFAINEQL